MSGSRSSSTSDSDGPSTPPAATATLPSSLKEARRQAQSEAEASDSFQDHFSKYKSVPWLEPYTFHTLRTQARFKHPSAKQFDHPDLQNLTAPHIESFNALWAQDPSVDPSTSSILPSRDSQAGSGASSSGHSLLKGLGLPGIGNTLGIGEGQGLLAKALKRLPPKVIFDGKGGPDNKRGNKMEISVESVSLARPAASERAKGLSGKKVFPSECRERLMTYRARMTARIAWRVNGNLPHIEERDLGQVPVMVKSNRCHLRGLSSRELVQRAEEPHELGGYFIINGNERLVRFLIVPRANHVTAIERPSFQKRGPEYSTKGCTIRCLHKNDLLSFTNTVHYLTNGGVTLRFSMRKSEYMIPVVMLLKSLVSATDKEIFSDLVQGDFDNTFLADRVELLLRGFKSYGLWTGEQCCEYLGDKFRVAMATPEDWSNFQVGSELIKRMVLPHLDTPRDKVAMATPEDWSNFQVGSELIKRMVLPHLDTPRDKYNMLIFMMHKLYSLVAGDCCPDNPDSPQHQEILLPGFLYGQIIKERIDEYLIALRGQVSRELRSKQGMDFFNASSMSKVFARVNSDLGARLANFLATGNLVSPTGLDLQQIGGFTVVAEKLNFYRYLAHFRSKQGMDFFNASSMSKVFARVSSDLGARLANFLATGNLVSPTGLDLQQIGGFTVVAEKLNFYRYLAHFRSVHRGAFFAELKTTTVRKLLPEAWGFLCPVHTPDGSPCGLLNHFSHSCRLITREVDTSCVPSLLSSLGMSAPFASGIDGRQHVVVQLDGIIIGYATPALAFHMANQLRSWKTEGKEKVPMDLEIGFVPTSKGGQYPGLYLFSSRARMMRPVRYLKNNRVDMVGPFEQVYLDVACMPDEIETGVTTHAELSPTNVLSVIANLTPFSDFNQSPRNMYQCQMGKQTMGTPSTAINHRTDNKLYRIQTPQTPVVRPQLHNRYSFDEAPNGANAIVAVISYTGYDMEDAMILNKSAHERGFGYGSVYKSETVDLTDMHGASTSAGILNLRFALGHDVDVESKVRNTIDVDGLPIIGAKVLNGAPMVAYFDDLRGKTSYHKFKGDDFAYIDTVRLIGTDSGEGSCTKIQIVLRIPRSPVIGDKFSSRHGQKGVCSQKWPAIDMPFSESGMQPDVIINPHAFPSRMTIGMLIESMAGKAGAMHGISQDCTPWTFSERDTPIEYFGEQLKLAGYNHVGNEPMYSGITGQELQADIYLGVVYYQRLRHMVNDKFQVRTTGPVHSLTRQPIKGRKRAGGIRFGEMERDALLAHGTSFLLQDRLMNCSDYSTSFVCRTCGSIISLGYDDAGLSGVQTLDGNTSRSHHPASLGPNGEYCRICRADDEVREAQGRARLPKGASRIPQGATRLQIGRENVIRRGNGGLDVIAIPYVLKYLSTELASVGMRICFEIV
ncbi:dna-directed rna polymerase i complex subunit rpa2 [Ceraceosorus bombacis]|uniref:DNA-directed RNA polymerase subunit beta n=1 Tax=Ceraceosorus bombacis TaxID=401625 RepID=A0A0N7L9I8_9BASI|nr:dna-directed rna polymerase i complex subunit rpa2 [Ceraceosorus bombacis]